ncbi:unnamed protein product [Didymodactylos carnosus]|uniref:Uncharacterized protein n=1 Tax=Didymodactylos carnosus TaxID=1234261 RepID=A0A815W3P0_9BILA|nr:unnamed protein product [Didymodactylos carnosus]CAF4398664.1 unnamed protein product [Didymodactylos carnosus]
MPPTGLLLRVVLVCAGRPHCQFKCSVTLQNSGQCYVFPIQNSVRHNARQRVCRPIREPLRKILKDKFKSGASVCAIHREYSAKRTSSEKSAFNYDFTGSTRKTFKKIKAEATVDTLLDPDEGKSLDELYKSTMAQINPGGKVPGALQVVCRHPLHLIVHTEASIRLFDCLVSSPHSIISWDATGSVVKAKNGKTILYYELTMTQSNVVEENSLIPITFMISESHTLKMVVNWMNWLKEHYKKTFEGKQFPKPEFVLSDRAQVFLQASLEVFNNSESYEMFLDRAYRIVTGQPHTNDLQQTNIHACLAHVMLAFRKITNKFMSSDLRELAMWAVAVIINTSVWSDMVANWRLICEYFLNLDTDKHDPIHHSLLMYRIQSLDANPNIQTCLRHQFTVKTEMKDNYKFEDGSTDDDDNTITKKIMSTSTKKLKTMSGLRTIDEEAELNSFNSLFRTTFNRIFEQCLESRGNAVNIKKETTMRMKGNCDWLTYLNKNFMPTVAIWSNLLLGNLKRHCSKVRSFNRFLLDKEIQRTTANSERRMGILKRTQLGGEVHGRLDVVLSILIQDLVQFVHSFTLGIVNVNLNANQSLQQEHFIPVQEQWRAKKINKSRGYYQKKPEQHVLNKITSSFLTPPLINCDLVLPKFSSQVPEWLKIISIFLLSITTFRSHSLPSQFDKGYPLLNELFKFVHKHSKLSRARTRGTQTFVTPTFTVPENFPTTNDVEVNIHRLMNEIILPILSDPVQGVKCYQCPNCKKN